MSNHIPDVTKMISNTPRTDEAQYGTGRVSVDFARILERELNAANAEIEEKRKDVVWLATEKAKLENYVMRLEEACRDMASEDTYNERDKEWFQVIESILGFHPVSITEALKIGISCIKNKNDRIKRLEETLDLVRPHCSFVHHSKKHQHAYGEPCPVVALIENAKEAKL